MRIVICSINEDENREVKNLIRSYLPEESMCSIDIMESCEKMLFEMSDEPNEVDLVISDTDFGEKMDSMDALRQLREIGYEGEILFITADKERVFESFDVRPANYLIKGEVTEEKTINAILAAATLARGRKRDMISFACAGEIKTIPVDDILYFEVSQKIVEVHYGEEVFEFYSTANKLENQLFERGFKRVHRAFLVNEKHIKSVKSGEVVLDNGETVPLAGKYAKNVTEDKKDTKDKKEKIENIENQEDKEEQSDDR